MTREPTCFFVTLADLFEYHQLYLSAWLYVMLLCDLYDSAAAVKPLALLLLVGTTLLL